MLPAKFEYSFILSLFALTGLSLSWDGLRIAIRRPQFLVTAAVFYLYCLCIEIAALNLGWWTFDEHRIVGLYVWRIPVEELALFAVFILLTLGTWEMLTNDSY